MKLVFNPSTGKFDFVVNKASEVTIADAGGYYNSTEVEGALQEVGATLATVTNPLLFKGAIAVASDFPTLADVEIGWFYKVTANVTDNDPSKTNTGQSFTAGDEIAWDGSAWVELGSTDLWQRIGTQLSPTNTGDSVYINEAQFNLTPGAHTWSEGLMYWNDEDKTLSIDSDINDVHYHVAQQEVVRVVNKTGADIPKGKVVYINGAQGNRPTIALADADSEATSSSTIGLTMHDIDDDKNGYVCVSGLTKDLDTSAFNVGDTLYVSSTAGDMTTTRPDAPKHAVKVGVVTVKDASVGVILLTVQNGYELSELHDVKITGIANNDLLQYDSGNSYWKNVPVGTAMGAYVLKAGDTMTGALTVYDGTDAIKSGDYPLYHKSYNTGIGSPPSTGTAGIVSYWKMDDNGIFPEDSSDANLISWWKYNEGSGSTLNDQQNLVNGTITNATWVGSGAFTASTNSLSFDGSGDFVSLGNNFYNSHTVGTISAWVKIDNTSGSKVVFGGANGASSTMLFWVGTLGDRIAYQHYTGAGANFVGQGGTTLSTGTWYYMTWQYTGTGNIKMYVNGVAETTSSGGGNGETGAWFSGLTGTIAYYHGKVQRSTGPLGEIAGDIDNVAIYNDARTADEILRDYRKSQTTYAADYVGTNHGAITNATFTGSGAFGYIGDNSLTFDGTTDYVDCGSGFDPSGASQLTIYAWVKAPSAGTNDGICGWYDGTDGVFIQSGQSSTSKLLFFAGNSGGDFGEADVDLTDWVFVALVYDGSGATNADRLKAYINGEAKTLTFNGVASIPATLGTITGSFKIGDIGSLNRVWNGTIDNVVIYSTALIDTDILSIYEAGLSSSTHHIFDTNSAVGAGKIASFKNQGTEKAYIDGSGNLSTYGILDTNGNEAIGLTATASAVNYPNFTNGATGNGVTLSALGDDTNISFAISSKGTGATLFGGTSQITASLANPVVEVQHSSAGRNGLAIVNTDAVAAGISANIAFYNRYNNTPTYARSGLIGVFRENATLGNSSSYFSLYLNANGGTNTIAERLRVSSAGDLRLMVSGASILDLNGNELIKTSATASAVNELTVTNAATGNNPSITASGGDTNIGITLTPKGTGGLVLSTGTFTAPALNITGNSTFGDASTDTYTFTGRMIVRTVNDAGMAATNGTQAEIVFNSNDSKFYGCTATGTPATWAALN